MFRYQVYPTIVPLIVRLVVALLRSEIPSAFSESPINYQI